MEQTKVCPKCSEEKSISGFYQTTSRPEGAAYCKACFNRYCMDRWIQRKYDAIAYKGNQCNRCNLHIDDSHYAVFEFHHLNPAEKDYQWTKLRLKPWEQVKLELDKCSLLCANCHRIIHTQE